MILIVPEDQKNSAMTTSRNSHQSCSLRKGVLRNFVKFTGKHPCRGLFFNKVVEKEFAKKETLAHVFSCEFCEISKNTFFAEHLWAAASALPISDSVIYHDQLFPSFRTDETCF